MKDSNATSIVLLSFKTKLWYERKLLNKFKVVFNILSSYNMRDYHQWVLFVTHISRFSHKLFVDKLSFKSGSVRIIV